MKQNIQSFRTDEDGHWVALLECGHRQHVRHNPPMNVRPWVLEESGREAHLGTSLECLLCDEESTQRESEQRKSEKR